MPGKFRVLRGQHVERPLSVVLPDGTTTFDTDKYRVAYDVDSGWFDSDKDLDIIHNQPGKSPKFERAIFDKNMISAEVQRPGETKMDYATRLKEMAARAEREASLEADKVTQGKAVAVQPPTLASSIPGFGELERMNAKELVKHAENDEVDLSSVKNRNDKNEILRVLKQHYQNVAAVR